MQLPEQAAAPVSEAAPAAPPGLAAGAAAALPPPVLPPVVVAPIIVVPPLLAPPGAPGGDGPSGNDAGSPSFTEPTMKQSEPSADRSLADGLDSAIPVSYRMGYVDYLRTAGTSQIAAVAVPGVVGIMALTGAGGLVGYRQAKAGFSLRAGSARFLG
ncbi:hypothetical protein JNN96_16280 [Mycobacterium sp. DSM 3803]|nr:hypothetical protein [Mycobacterium sp. DSM 3803]